MLALAGVACTLNWLTRQVHWPANPFWRVWLFNALWIMLVGAGEMLVRSICSSNKLVWLAAITIAAAALLTSVTYGVQFQQITLDFPIPPNSRSWIDLSFVISPFAQTAITWLAIPLALRMPGAGRRSRLIIATASLATVASFIFLFGSIVYFLAERSVAGHGPFKPQVGAGILTIPNSDAARGKVWHTLEGSDWTQPIKDAYDRDWREWIIRSFYQRDPTGTANELAEILQRHPSRLLARYAATSLVAQKKYQVFPWLLRYAVLPHYLGDQSIAQALADARIPQAVLGQIDFWAINDDNRLITVPDAWTGDDQFDGPGRDTFAKLLATPAPQTRQQAIELFWKLQANLAPPLPKLQQSEIAQLMNCLKRYYEAWQGEHFDLQTPEPDWDHASLNELQQQVDARVREIMTARNKSGGLPPRHFAVVMIDQATEKELGTFPYDRTLYAQAIDALADAKVRGVVLKFFIDLPKSPEGDSALAAAMKKTKVILQARIDNSQTNPNPLDDRFILKNLDQENIVTIAGHSGWLPLPRLSENAHDLGFIDSTPAIELVPLVERYQNHYVKSLYTAALELALGQNATIHPGVSIEIQTKNHGQIKPKFTVAFGVKEIPTDEHCFATIKLPPQDNLQSYSFIDLIHHKIPAEKLADRVIILGYDGEKMETNKTAIGMVKGHRLFCYQLFSLYRAAPVQ